MGKINQIVITKASGQQAPFSPEMLKRSLLNVGASEDLVDTKIKLNSNFDSHKCVKSKAILALKLFISRLIQLLN
jgi:hypothetical protein